MSRATRSLRPHVLNFPTVGVIMVALVAWALNPSPEPGSAVALLDHAAFRLYYSCQDRTALRFYYSLTVDEGNAKRPSFFMWDPAISNSCQQKTTKSYSRVHPEYDRGHLVPSNHMDNSDETILKANYMTNIVPQIQSMNRGIWAETEIILECYRDIYPLDIYGGVIYTNDTTRDYFVSSHGIRTPAFFWKVVVAHPSKFDAIAIAWLIPNQPDLGPLENYIVSINEIESSLTDKLGPIPVDISLKGLKASRNWDIPRYCDKS